MKAIDTKTFMVATLIALAACGRTGGDETQRAAGHAEHDQARVADGSGGAEAQTIYTCPMHPSVRAREPGNCPICGMTLVAVTTGAEHDASITLDAERLQRIGVRTAPIELSPVVAELRTVGRVAYDESRLSDVTLKVDGWIERLYVGTTGQAVKAGEPLFALYSPDLLAAERELLAALASRRAAAGGGAPDRSDYLVEAARSRLMLSGLDRATVASIEKSGEARERVDIVAPTDGIVVEKAIVAGARAEAGMRLFRIADVSRVWIEADLYEREAASVSVGDRAEVRLAKLGDRAIDGTVSLLSPSLDETTRTVRARIEVANVGFELKPGMYADVVFTKELGDRLAVPAAAVLYAGDKRYVFVDLGEGRFQPRSVTLGARAGERIVVESGLHEGERIVTSGTFLIAAESRLKVALEDWK